MKLYIIFIFIIIMVYWLPKIIFIIFLENYYNDIVVRNKEIKYNYVALTFDDIPLGNYFEIINLLDYYNMKATFLIISDQVNEYDKYILINAVKNNHQLANHGKTHDMHYTKSIIDLSYEIQDCDKIINEIYFEANITNNNIKYYRPGSGFFGNTMLNYLSNNKYKLLLGSVYPWDVYIKNPTINFYYIKFHIEPGDIIIMHDRNWTIDLLKKLLPWLQSNSLNSVTVENLFNGNLSKQYF